MIGSRQWMKLSNGNLSFKAQLSLINQILVPSSLAYVQSFLKLNNNALPITHDKLQIPDTPIVKEAINELSSTQHQAIINHSWRCFFWGTAIAQNKAWQFDQESFLIACLMHDIGLVNHSKAHSCNCFTLESALRTEQLCLNHQYSTDKTENISNAICLHMNGFLDEQNSSLSKEVLLLQKATSCDVIGSDISLIHSDFKHQILTEYPRAQFNREMTKLIGIEARKNPKSRTATLRKLGLPLMIKMNIYKE